MSNIEIAAPLFDGSLIEYHHKGESCRKAVRSLVGDDFSAQPRCLNLLIHTQSGKLVDLTIPFDGRAVAKVFVDGELL